MTRWRGTRSWRHRLNVARLSIVKAGKSAGQVAHRVAAQGMTRARRSGAELARRVIAAQRAARLDPALMRESARSVANRPMTRQSDRHWQAAYTAVAERAVPGLGPAPADRPGWPYQGGWPRPAGPGKPDPEAGQ